MTIHHDQHRFSYQYPHRFESFTDLISFLYKNDGVCSSMLTGMYAGNHVEALVDLVCLVLDRNNNINNNNPTSSSSSSPPSSQLTKDSNNNTSTTTTTTTATTTATATTTTTTATTTTPTTKTTTTTRNNDDGNFSNPLDVLTTGTRYGEAQFIAALGINQGRVPITPTYFGPIVAVTGDPTGFTPIQQLKPELIDFFRILRSSTSWTSQTFRCAIETSELNQYRDYLSLTHWALSPVEQYILLCTKAYELAFYKPFLHSSSPSSPPSPHPTTLDFTTPPPTHEYITQHHILDITAAADEFLQWTGLHTLTAPYQQQLTLFLGINLVLSWKHTVTHLTTLLKHIPLSLNLNFLLWIYQIFFPPYLYTQFPKSYSLEMLKILKVDTTMTTTTHHQMMERAINHEGGEEPSQSPYNFLLATRGIIVGAFITHVPEIALEQYYYTQRLTEITRELAMFEAITSQSHHLLPSDLNTPYPQHLLTKLSLPMAFQQPDNASGLMDSGTYLSINHGNPNLHNANNHHHNNNGTGGRGGHDDDDDDDDDVDQDTLANHTNHNSRQSSPLIKLCHTTPPQLLADSHSDSDIDGDQGFGYYNAENGNQNGSNYEDSDEMSGNESSSSGAGHKLIGRLKRLRVKQAIRGQHKYSNKSRSREAQIKKLLALDPSLATNTPPLPQSRKPRSLHTSHTMMSPYHNALALFYTQKLSEAIAVQMVVHHMCRFSLALPAHLILLTLCATIYNSPNLCTELSRYGLKINSYLLTDDFDPFAPASAQHTTAIQQLLGFTTAQHQAHLTQLFSSHTTPVLHPTFPPSFTPQLNPTNPYLNAHKVSPDLCFSFAGHSVQLYHTHIQTPYSQTIDLVLRLAARRGLTPAITAIHTATQTHINNLTAHPSYFPQLQTALPPAFEETPQHSSPSSNLSAHHSTVFPHPGLLEQPAPIFLTHPSTLPYASTYPKLEEQQRALSLHHQQAQRQNYRNQQQNQPQLLPPLIPPTAQLYFLIDVITSTNRCTIPFLDNLLKLAPAFSVDTSFHHHHSNIIIAIVTSPFLSPTQRGVLFNYFIHLTTRVYMTKIKIGIDCFLTILHTAWALRSITPPPLEIISFIFTNFVDRQTWSRRFSGSVQNIAMVLTNTMRMLFGVELETPTRRIIVTKCTLPQITLQRQLMLTIFQYIFPPNEFLPDQSHHGLQGGSSSSSSNNNNNLVDGGIKLFFHPEIAQHKQLREALLRPIFIIGSHQSLNYLLAIGYRLDPFDFTRFLNHSTHSLDYRDCINVYSIMRAFYLHLHIAHAKTTAVNMIELEQLENLEGDLFNESKTVRRNRNGFERFVGQRLPAHLFDLQTVKTGFEAIEIPFHQLIESSASGKSYSDNTTLLHEEEFIETFQLAQQAYGYVQTNPTNLGYLSCDVITQAQTTTARLQKITHYASNANHNEVENADEDSEDSNGDDNNNDNNNDDCDDDNHQNITTNKKLTTKERRKFESQVFTIDPLIFEALSHYHTQLCPQLEHRSTTLEFFLIFNKHMENFLSHFIGSLLIYRTSYSSQSPLLYNTLRCLLPRLDLYPAQFSYLLVDRFHGFNPIQHFNYQLLLDSYLEDSICPTLGLTPTQMEYLLTPPAIANKRYHDQQLNRRRYQEAQHEKDTISQFFSPQRDELEQSESISPHPHSTLEGTRLDDLLNLSKGQGSSSAEDHGDDYDLVIMSIEQREAYRLQISQLIQTMIISIILQHKNAHPKSSKPQAPTTNPSLCFDSFKLFYHLLKYIPLPSITLYPHLIPALNSNPETFDLIGEKEDGREDKKKKKRAGKAQSKALLLSTPSRPGIQPQFLYFIMQNLPVNPTSSIHNDLFDLYIQQNGTILHKGFLHHGLIPPHLFAPTTFNLTYYRSLIDTFSRYEIPVATLIDSMWQNLPIQALQHTQFPTQNELELVQFLFEFVRAHQSQVNLYQYDYKNVVLGYEALQIQHGIGSNDNNNNNNTVTTSKPDNLPVRSVVLREALEPKWNLRSLRQVQHISQITDITGTNLLFWLSGMAFPPRTCLALFSIFDHFLFSRKSLDRALLSPLPSPLAQYISPHCTVAAAPLLTNLQSQSYLLGGNPKLSYIPQPLYPPQSSDMPQAPTSEPPNDLTRGDTEAIPLDQLAKLHHSHDIYQEHGPDLPELPPELPNYPLLRFQVIEQYHQQELQQPPQNDLHSSQPSSNQQFTSPGSIPLVPFEALFHKDHSGRTILHHLVESTELSPSRLGLLACAAVDPFEQRNFSTLYAAMSNQAIPFLSPLPPSLSSDVFSGSQKPSNVALLDGNHKSTIVGHDDNEEDEDDEDNLVEIEEVGGGQEVNNNMSSSEHSVATVLNAMTTVQFNTPNLPLLFTLGNAIKSPLHSAVDSGNNNSSVFLSSHGDEELLTFLDTLNATTTESITKLVQQQQQQQQSQPPPNNHPVRSIITQRKHLIYNPPSSLLPQTHDPVIRSHHLGLLHRTIFSTDQPLLFWLSYINYYCQMTNLPQAPVYLASIQTPRTRQHHLSYRKAVMLRQLRHRFPLTIDPTSPEELQNLMRHFHQSNHKRKQQQRRLGEREQDRRTPRYSGHVPYSKPHPSKSGYGGKLHLDNIPSSDSSSDDDEDDETSDDDDDEDDDDDDDDRDGDDNGDNKASKSHQSKKKSYNNKRGDHHRKNSKAQKTHNRYQSKQQQPQKSTYQEREAKRQLKLANKQRRAVVGFSATVIGLAVATIGYFWLTTYAHGDDEQIEPTGEITTYQYTKDHDRLVREQKSKRRR